MKMTGSSKIYMYSVTYGPEINPEDSRQVGRACKSMRDELKNIFVVFNFGGPNAMFSTLLVE